MSRTKRSRRAPRRVRTALLARWMEIVDRVAALVRHLDRAPRGAFTVFEKLEASRALQEVLERLDNDRPAFRATPCEERATAERVLGLINAAAERTA